MLGGPLALESQPRPGAAPHERGQAPPHPPPAHGGRRPPGRRVARPGRLPGERAARSGGGARSRAGPPDRRRLPARGALGGGPGRCVVTDRVGRHRGAHGRFVGAFPVLARHLERPALHLPRRRATRGAANPRPVVASRAGPARTRRPAGAGRRNGRTRSRGGGHGARAGVPPAAQRRTSCTTSCCRWWPPGLHEPWAGLVRGPGRRRPGAPGRRVLGGDRAAGRGRGPRAPTTRPQPPASAVISRWPVRSRSSNWWPTRRCRRARRWARRSAWPGLAPRWPASRAGLGHRVARRALVRPPPPGPSARGQPQPPAWHGRRRAHRGLRPLPDPTGSTSTPEARGSRAAPGCSRSSNSSPASKPRRPSGSRRSCPHACATTSPRWLDELCLSGEIVWARLTPRAERPGRQRHAVAGHASGLRAPRRPRDDVAGGAGRRAGPRTRGGCRRRRAGRPAHPGRLLPTRVGAGDRTARRPRWTRACGIWWPAGLVTADAFSAVRSLLSARDRWRTRTVRRPSNRLARRRGPAGSGIGEGRWSLLPGPEVLGTPAVDDGVLVPGNEELAEAVAHQLLVRWGVVAWEIWGRESFKVPWREVVWALRRMEARGVVLGGRFVAGLAGEQYALPEAFEQLQRVHRDGRDGEQVTVAGADPLNMTGAIVGGTRVPTRAPPKGRVPRRRRGRAARGRTERVAKRTIDLNADVGEATDPEGIERERALLGARHVGQRGLRGHAGDEDSMKRHRGRRAGARCAGRVRIRPIRTGRASAVSRWTSTVANRGGRASTEQLARSQAVCREGRERHRVGRSPRCALRGSRERGGHLRRAARRHARHLRCRHSARAALGLSGHGHGPARRCDGARGGLL